MYTTHDVQLDFSSYLVASCSMTVGMCFGWSSSSVSVEQTESFKNVMYFGMIASIRPVIKYAPRKGLRELLLIAVGCIIVGSLLIACTSQCLGTIIIGRLLHGFGAGAVSIVVPNYTVEISQLYIRSTLTSLHYISVMIGVLFSNLLMFYGVPLYLNALIMISAFCNVVAMVFVEDPLYYQPKCDNSLASAPELLKFEVSNDTRTNNGYNPLQEFIYESHNSTPLLSDFYTQKKFKDPILVLVGLVCLHKFSGIYYQKIELQSIGTKLYTWDQRATLVFINIIEIMMAVVCTFLVHFIEKKNLLVISGFGMAVVLALMNITYDAELFNPTEKTWLPTFMFMYITFYSIGYGPILWMVMPEICPRQSRLWTSGLTVSLYALLTLIIDQPFYNDTTLMYSGVDFVLLYFTIVCTTGAVLTHIYVPETKDYSY